MKNIPHQRLVLFFTRGVSLQTWDQTGMLDREIALYKEYLKHGWMVSFITYGDKKDLQYKNKLKGIKILCNRWGLPQRIYRNYLHLIFFQTLGNADVIKTNQFKGAEIAIKAKKRSKVPLVIRCGYLWSSIAAERIASKIDSSETIEIAKRNESLIFSSADLIVVTTPTIKEHITRSYNIDERKIEVIPNYVDVKVFKPVEIRKISRRVCCVAKFNEQKNLINLFHACKGIDMELDLIGSGPQESALKELQEQLGIRVNFVGNLPNHKIPEYMSRSEIFILPSLFEGHPKTLIEAMSCGLPVIGSDVPGIREIIEHEKNGYLCGTDPVSIRSAIETVLSNLDLQVEMGKNARGFVLQNYSLEQIFQKELSIMERVLLNAGRQ